MDMKELSSILQQNGIVGAGGAGFPTYAKLDQRAETIILNCAECEPLLRLHRQLLEKYAREIVDTFHLVGQAVGAKEVIIGIKKAYKQTIEAVESVIGEYPEVRLGLLDEVYPAGDEVVLIYEVTGKVVRPGGLPIESGVAVFNVETIYNVWRAMNQQTPVVDKLVSVVAEVEHPVTVRVPIGTTIEEVVALAGGSNSGGPGRFSQSDDSGPGAVNIAPQDVPLAPLPETPFDTTLINDDEIPLAPLPKTGQGSVKSTLTMVMSGILLMLTAKNKKRKDEDA